MLWDFFWQEMSDQRSRTHNSLNTDKNHLKKCHMDNWVKDILVCQKKSQSWVSLACHSLIRKRGFPNRGRATQLKYAFTQSSEEKAWHNPRATESRASATSPPPATPQGWGRGAGGGHHAGGEERRPGRRGGGEEEAGRAAAEGEAHRRRHQASQKEGLGEARAAAHRYQTRNKYNSIIIQYI